MEETEPKLGFGHLTSIQLHYQQYLRNLVDILSEIQWNSNGLPIGEEPNPEDLKRLQTKFETMLQGLQQIEKLLQRLPESFPSESQRVNELEILVDKKRHAEKALLEEEQLLRSRREQIHVLLKDLANDLYGENQDSQNFQENFIL